MVSFRWVFSLVFTYKQDISSLNITYYRQVHRIWFSYMRFKIYIYEQHGFHIWFSMGYINIINKLYDIILWFCAYYGQISYIVSGTLSFYFSFFFLFFLSLSLVFSFSFSSFLFLSLFISALVALFLSLSHFLFHFISFLFLMSGTSFTFSL